MRNKRRDASISRLAARQHGLVTSAQLRDAGISPSATTRRVSAGRLHRIHRGVYAVGHSRLSLEGRCLAAAFACGEDAAVSHASAAYLWGLLSSLPLPVDVTVPGGSGRRARHGIRVHSSLLLDGCVTRRGGIPVTTVSLTLRDLHRAGDRDRYLRASRRAIDLRRIEAPAGAAEELTRSELERRFLALCRRHRLPAPRVNARVAGCEVDFVWRDRGVVVETDGYAFHSGRSAFETDRERSGEAPETVAAAVRAALWPRGGGARTTVPAVADRALFFYDFNSPYAYLAAERISGLFAEAGAEQPEWVPISFGHILKESGRRPWSFEEDRSEDFAEIQRRASERGLPEVLYPEGWPIENYSLNPLRAATYAKESGRVVSFSLAAFRQVFAGGRDMSDVDNVLIAAAACELHPKAVLKGIETQSVKDKLRAATQRALELGVEGVPTVAVGGELYWGDDRLEAAVAAAAARS